ncbi:MAG TPA: DedA family protein, partial [Verrucomicrobiae bacterium]|nr:DedA family protein [Verrucomicrobiae bacterium]
MDFLVRHGYVVLFAVVLGEQLGLPLVGAPVLMAAGALAGAGRFSLTLAVGLAVAACLIGDLVWFEMGRRRGAPILSLLCRISLEPDSCVRRTEDIFSRWGARVLLVAKFVPGLNTVAPPLAGVVGMPWKRFLRWDAGGRGGLDPRLRRARLPVQRSDRGAGAGPRGTRSRRRV